MDGFDVDPVTLSRGAGSMTRVGAQLRSVEVVTTVPGQAGLPGARTPVALQLLAQRLSAGVDVYAGEVERLADLVEASATTYDDTDGTIAASLASIGGRR